MPNRHSALHIVSELAAVVLVAPYLLVLADRQQRQSDANFLLVVAMLTFLVDGYLLLQWI